MRHREPTGPHPAARLAGVALVAAGSAAILSSLRPSAQMRLATLALRWTSRPTRDAEAARRGVAGRSDPRPAPTTSGVRRRCAVHEAQVLGRPVYTLTPRRGGSRWHILYTHGGAFVNPLQKAHWDIVAALVDATGATVTVPLYPLAPEHTHEAAFRQLDAVYRRLLARVAPARIVLCGDSAGANLALAQALRCRDAGIPLPGHVVLFSPWLDLAMANPAARAVEPLDVMLRVDALREWGRWWAGTADPGSPALSPLAADLGGLPPIQLYQGTHDVLLPDARTFRDRVAAAGGRLAYHETRGGFHAFMGATFTPEAQHVFRQLRAHLRAAPAATPRAAAGPTAAGPG
jgi:acetyl esterase/lipase